MTFTSNIFLIGLLPWFAVLFYLFRNKPAARRVLIILGNIVFYIWSGVYALIFLCIFSVLTWAFCRMCGSISAKKKPFIRRVIFFVGIILVITPLITVKYTSLIPNDLTFLGISFYTFEAVSVLCDVYMGRITEAPSLIDTIMYLTFFPTVTSGPIIRFDNFKKGFGKAVNVSDYSRSIDRIVIGLFKKMLIADKLAPLADYFFSGVSTGHSYSVIGLWAGSIAYTLQLFFDFSGYTDMAIGIGGLMGFDIPENFRAPYTAGSISDFWKRWHITLTSWFRDYIYIPLGGNRVSIPRHLLNMAIVWLLTGIWHGADLSFVLWGIGYLILLIIEKYVPVMRRIGDHWYGHLYALFFINLLWVPFRADSISTALHYIAGMFGLGCSAAGSGAPIAEDMVIRFLPLLIIAVLLCLPWRDYAEKLDPGRRIRDSKCIRIIRAVMVCALLVLSVSAMINSAYSPYIYGDF